MSNQDIKDIDGINKFLSKFDPHDEYSKIVLELFFKIMMNQKYGPETTLTKDLEILNVPE